MRRSLFLRRPGLLVIAGRARGLTANSRPPTRMCPEDVSYWTQLWHTGGDTFTLPDVNENLVSFMEQLLPGRSESGSVDPRAVLVPLCGASVDLAYLAERQGAVWGVDVAGVALQEFADSHGGGIVRSSPLGDTASGMKALGVRDFPNLTLLHGDFLALRPRDFRTLGPGRAAVSQPACDIHGPFDAIWDRGGLTSIPTSLRPAYATLLHKLLRPGGRLLLEFLSTNVDPELGERTVSGLLADAFPCAQPGPALVATSTQIGTGSGSGGSDAQSSAAPVQILRCADVRSDFPDFNPPGLAYLNEVVLLAVKRCA